MGLTTNPERTSKIIQILMDWYYGNEGKRDGLMSGAVMPESAPPEGMRRGSYEHIMWLTLTVAIDYQRDAASLWNSAKLTWENESTRWVFLPNESRNRTYQDLVIALARYRLSQKHNKDAQIWWTVSTSFFKLFEGDPRKLLELYKYDAEEVYNQMHSKHKKDFPYLSGDKILLLWIRMLKDEANIDLANLENVRIPIDIHTARATLTTGCLVGDFDGHFQDLVTEAQHAWEESCKKTDSKYYPLQLDEPLWNLSRLGCNTRINGSVCPLSSECKLSNFCTANTPEAIISLSNREKIHVRTVYPK